MPGSGPGSGLGSGPGSGHCPTAADGQCAFDDPRPYFDRSGLVGEVSVMRCRHCGIGISQPPIADVAFLYADRSSQDFQPGTRGLTHWIKRIAFRGQARRLIGQIGKRPGRLVDFGCGSGLFTRQMAEAFPDIEVIGADFHDRSPAIGAAGYRSFAELDRLRGTADLVIAMHVLEHDDDPAALLARIVRIAKPGGRVVLEVPNIDCVWAPLFGRYWDAWYLPYHRTHFNRASLRALLDAAGLVVEQDLAACVPTMGRSIANLLHRRNSAAFILLGAALHPLQWVGERLSRRPSAIRMIARLPG